MPEPPVHTIYHALTPILCACKIDSITDCVICGKTIDRQKSVHLDTCGTRCFKELWKRQVAIRTGKEKP